MLNPNWEKILGGTQKPWDKFLKIVVNVAAPCIALAVASKSNSPKVGQATTINLKSYAGGQLLKLTDQRRGGLPLKVM